MCTTDVVSLISLIFIFSVLLLSLTTAAEVQVLADVQRTFPHAQTITLDTGHLSPEHLDAPRLVREWLLASGEPTTGGQPSGSADLNVAVRRRAKATPDAVAVFDAKEKITTTWRELEALILHCRGHLVDGGVGVGERLPLCMHVGPRVLSLLSQIQV